MKKVITAGLVIATALFGSVALAKGNSGKGGGANDVEVLHWPSSDDLFLVIPMNGLAGHLRHGDCLPDGIPQVEVPVLDRNGDPTGDFVLSDDPAALAAIDKAGADITYVDGCLLDDDDDNDDE